MGKTTKIVCDKCDKNITYTSNCEDYRIAVTNERVRSRGGVVTDMALYPALESDLYFCGRSCLLG